ncbi:MAG: helix-turn-helix domain-containing protein [Steroidobacteraceae bacterium]|jgi:IclR family mhp operon transcriptional activator|nr:helix-turn-helix domain-containing protein [Steroidobacteraceae bacterium]
MPRSLSRGLAVILALNAEESATVVELARALRIPRASLYRVLATLVADGFVEVDRTEQRYRLTPRVRALSDGFSDDLYLAAVARPELLSVTRTLSWPVSLGMLSGTEIVVRASTDHASPIAADRFGVGYRMPLLTTATGLCVLAHLDRSARDDLLEAVARAGAHDAPAGRERTALEVRLREIRNRGFSTFDRRRQSTDATSIAVPVRVPGGDVKGAITLRYAKAALALPAAVQKFVPTMREAARRIAERAGAGQR